MNDKFDYVSNDDSLLCIQRYCLQEGKAAGTQMIRVSNAAGLELHIAVDRALDMAELRFRGISFSLPLPRSTTAEFYARERISI